MPGWCSPRLSPSPFRPQRLLTHIRKPLILAGKDRHERKARPPIRSVLVFACPLGAVVDTDVGTGRRTEGLGQSLGLKQVVVLGVKGSVEGVWEEEVFGARGGADYELTAGFVWMSAVHAGTEG